MRYIPLCGPPGYEYQTCGPWFVCHVDPSDHADAWVQWTLEGAVLRFWRANVTPMRRVLLDARGVTILGCDGSDPSIHRMVGNREALESTLAMVRRSQSVDGEMEILKMIEIVRSLDGQSV